MKKLKNVLLIMLFAILLLSTKSNAATETEKIYDYQSEIYIQEDASIIVEETIKVYAAGNQIKSGIAREFPTKYKDKSNNSYNVTFEVIEVLKNGNHESYTLENVSNGIKMYIGDSNKTLSNGYYTYTIKYKTTRQMGYFDDHDELYWNVNGNGCTFTIDKVTAIVHLPNNANMNVIKLTAYTGSQGSNDKNYLAYTSSLDNTVTFTTKSKLYPEENLSIVVGFEKGLIHEPTFKEKVGYFFSDNKGIFVGLCGALILAVYCYITWAKVGKDPKKDVIIPRYNPPENLSPAEVKFIDSMGKYDKVFEASILNLAVNGYIKIETAEEEISKYKSTTMTLIKQDKEIGNDISEDEIDIYKNLPSKTTLKYSSSLQKKLESIQGRQRKFLWKKIEGVMYSKNSKYVGISIAISIVVLIIAFIISSITSIAEISCAIMNLVCISCLFYGNALTFKEDKKSKKSIYKKIEKLIIIIFEIGIICAFASFFGTGIETFICLLAIINILYMFLIKAYTKEGRKIKDEIEGFKLFIKTASEDEIMNQTPETFDKYFPYAYALGLENEWAEKFEGLLKSYNYEPTWCTGMSFDTAFNSTVFTSSFTSSFSHSISSSSTAPGSSSGFSSGGSGGGGRRPEERVDGKLNK